MHTDLSAAKRAFGDMVITVEARAGWHHPCSDGEARKVTVMAMRERGSHKISASR